MEITISDHNKHVFAELESDVIIINTVDDALDLLANCAYQGAQRIIIYERNLNPEFFNLKTKLAGEILQKFSNYNVFLGIVGNFEKFGSSSLKAFIYESNKRGRIVFAETKEQVKQMLSRN